MWTVSRSTACDSSQVTIITIYRVVAVSSLEHSAHGGTMADETGRYIVLRLDRESKTISSQVDVIETGPTQHDGRYVSMEWHKRSQEVA